MQNEWPVPEKNENKTLDYVNEKGNENFKAA